MIRLFLHAFLLIIGFPIFQPLEPATLFCQLFFCICNLLFQLFGCWHRRFHLFLQIKNTASLSDKRYNLHVEFQALDGKLSVQTDCFPSKAGMDSRISGARGTAPCTKRSDAKQPGLPSSELSTLQSAHIQCLPCIEARPLLQRIIV